MNYQLNVDQFDNYIKLKNGVKLLTNFKTTTKDKIEYFEMPISFDIEDTSFYTDGNNTYSVNEILALPEKEQVKYEKQNAMYIWQFDYNGYSVWGRTWDEFIDLLYTISKVLRLNPQSRRAIIYVHNLAHEFSFIKSRFNWLDVFVMTNRKVVYAINSLGFEFRCSLILSGVKLADLPVKTIQKAKGDLDYTLMRHSTTPLTDTELNYCKLDVKVLSEYIQSQIESNGSITEIPLTKTGFVRRTVRNNVLNEKYKKYMKALVLSEHEYKVLKQAYMGGFTHSNPLHTNELLEDIHSQDITSSYPTVICSERFPCSKPIKIEVPQNVDLDNTDELFVVDVIFYDVKSKINYEYLLSKSKCTDIKSPKCSNGRLISAKMIRVTLTNIDYKMFKAHYKFSSEYKLEAYAFKSDYLPKGIVESVINFYCDKTVLKGVTGKELEYKLAKENVNSVYGMMVTDIIRDSITFDGVDFLKTIFNEKDITALLQKYANSKNTFCYYAWGVWITAYARRNLWLAIDECKNDYVYADTDSCKYFNYDKHKKFFENYNIDIQNKIKKCLKALGLDTEKATPKNIKGEIKPLGVFDYEGCYTKFKTLGAKRYVVEKNNEYESTISGLPKHALEDYCKENNLDIFEFFKDEMELDYKNSRKLINTYLDYEQKGTMIDYLGNKNDYYEKTSVHLQPTGYKLSVDDEFLELLTSLQ